MSFSEDKTGNDGPRRRSLARYDGSTPIPPPNCLAAHGQDLPPLPQELPVADTPRCSISSDFSVNSLASLVVRDTSIGQFDGVNRMDENLHTPTNCTKETRKQSNIPIFRIDHRATTGLMGFVQMADSQEKPKIDKHKRKKRKAKSRRGVVRVDAANSCYTEQDEFGFNIYVRLEDNLRNTFMQFGEAEIGNVAPIQDEQCGMLAKVSKHQGISTGAEMVLKFTCLQKSTQSWNRTRVNSGYAIAREAANSTNTASKPLVVVASNPSKASIDWARTNEFIESFMKGNCDVFGVGEKVTQTTAAREARVAGIYTDTIVLGTTRQFRIAITIRHARRVIHVQSLSHIAVSCTVNPFEVVDGYVHTIEPVHRKRDSTSEINITKLNPPVECSPQPTRSITSVSNLISVSKLTKQARADKSGRRSSVTYSADESSDDDVPELDYKEKEVTTPSSCDQQRSPKDQTPESLPKAMVRVSKQMIQEMRDEVESEVDNLSSDVGEYTDGIRMSEDDWNATITKSHTKGFAKKEGKPKQKKEVAEVHRHTDLDIDTRKKKWMLVPESDKLSDGEQTSSGVEDDPEQTRWSNLQRSVLKTETRKIHKSQSEAKRFAPIRMDHRPNNKTPRKSVSDKTKAELKRERLASPQPLTRSPNTTPPTRDEGVLESMWSALRKNAKDAVTRSSRMRYTDVTGPTHPNRLASRNGSVKRRTVAGVGSSPYIRDYDTPDRRQIYRHNTSPMKNTGRQTSRVPNSRSTISIDYSPIGHRTPTPSRQLRPQSAAANMDRTRKRPEKTLKPKSPSRKGSPSVRVELPVTNRESKRAPTPHKQRMVSVTRKKQVNYQENTRPVKAKGYGTKDGTKRKVPIKKSRI